MAGRDTAAEAAVKKSTDSSTTEACKPISHAVGARNATTVQYSSDQYFSERTHAPTQSAAGNSTVASYTVRCGLTSVLANTISPNLTRGGTGARQTRHSIQITATLATPHRITPAGSGSNLSERANRVQLIRPRLEQRRLYRHLTDHARPVEPDIGPEYRRRRQILRGARHDNARNHAALER